MTPEEFEPIAVWMGWHKDHLNLLWFDDQGGGKGCRGYVVQKTSLTPSECYEALERLVEKDMMYELWSGVDGDKTIHGCSVCTKARWLESLHESIAEDPKGTTGRGSTIHKAIEAAILDLLKAEGGKK